MPSTKRNEGESRNQMINLAFINCHIVFVFPCVLVDTETNAFCDLCP